MPRNRERDIKENQGEIEGEEKERVRVFQTHY